MNEFLDSAKQEKLTFGQPTARVLERSRGAPRIGTGARVTAPIDVELFAGAGGLTLGLARAGMAPAVLYESNAHCCKTLRANAGTSIDEISGAVHVADVGNVDWSTIGGPVRLLSGGPPCQPFSLAGKHRADQDDRNEFPSMLRAVRALNPQAVLLENVPGLVRPSFRPYLDYIVRQLESPSIAPRHDELWQDHDARIVKHQRGRQQAREYHVRQWVLNAADFGVAQARVRLVLLAVRADFDPPGDPLPTHSRAALIHAQEEGTYWTERGLPKKRRHEWPRRLNGPAANVDGVLPWRTVRDALAGLPKPPKVEGDLKNHWLIDGARTYKRHTGSELDWPAKTVKAGVHGVAGGENVLMTGTGSFRYFSLREMARLQCFPDSYAFEGPRSRIVGQIGNAVPCELGRVMGDLIVSTLAGSSSDDGRKPTRVR